MPIAFSFFYRLTGRYRTEALNQNLGRILAFVAGFINAGGFFIIQQYTSHMTGILSLAADEIALGRYAASFLMIGFVFCFLVGACMTTVIVIKAREKHLHAQYAIPLLIESVLILIIMGVHQLFVTESFIVPVVIALLCFLMGLQNAVITKASKAIIRTTHITGMTTDLGIEIGRALLSRSKKNTGYNQHKAALHFSIILTFFIGGVVGALSLENFGSLGLVPIAVVLIVISVPPLLRDYRHHRR